MRSVKRQDRRDRLRRRVADACGKAGVGSNGTWIFPVILVLLAIVAIVYVDDQPADDFEPLRFSVASDNALSAAQAERATRPLARDRLAFSTSRAEHPFWFRVSLPARGDKPRLLEFPSRHAQSAQCWTTARLDAPLASGARPFSSERMRPVRAGFALSTHGLDGGDVLCRIGFVGPASVTINLWDAEALSSASHAYARASGLLNGGLITLALFVAFVATLNRERTFLLFAGWLIGNLRLAAISAGWDTEWFGLAISGDAVFEVRKLTIALYVVLTVALFFSLFKADLERMRFRWSRRTLVAACCVLVTAAVVLPFRWFLPVLWAVAPLAIAVGWWMLARILRQNRSRMAVCYALSWSVPLLAVLSEVLAAATGQRLPLGMLNSVSGSIVSSLLVALAFAERLRAEREDKTQAREQTTQALDRLHHLVDHDPLTDLLNRRGLESELRQALRRVDGEAQAPLSVAYLDLDRFKLVNDLFGHGVGDEVLVQVARRVGSILQAGQTLARIGGDEFVLVLPGYDRQAARQCCERALAALVDEPIHVGASAFSVAGSLGVVTLDQPLDANSVLTACDRACIEAKQAGGRRVIDYGIDDRGLVQHFEDVRFAGLLRQRLPVERLSMVMQPIVSLGGPSGSLAYEALIRMHDENGDAVPTGKLIGAAERNGLMPQIDRWVVSYVIDWLEAHPAHLQRLDFASVNLSGASLNDERFIADLMAMLAAHPQAARKLCFEITETVALYDLRHTRRIVERIRSFGAMTALDDFGAGYTSFSYLKQLPADILKIDGSYVKNLDTQPADQSIVRAIAGLGHQLGVRIVAEWVENAGTVELLAELGVDFAQGWALARPLQPAQLVQATDASRFIENADVRRLLGLDPAGAGRNAPRSARADRLVAPPDIALNA